MDKLMENLSNGFANFYRTAYGNLAYRGSAS